MPKGIYKDGVTRNEKTKCWLARILRHRISTSEYFRDNDKRWGGKEGAHQAALQWYAKKLAAAPHKLTRKNVLTERNTSGFVGVHYSQHIIKRGDRCYDSKSWVAQWPGCPHSGGLSWSISYYGENESYVLAVLSRQAESINRRKIIEEMDAIKGTQEYSNILSRMPKNK